MATSGVTTFQLTATQIINSALRKLGALSKGQIADTEDLTTGLEALNVLIPTFQSLGFQLWKRVDRLIPMTAGVDTYTLSQPSKPATIAQAYLEDITSASRQPVEIISHFNYTRLPNSSMGLPVQMTYQPLNTTGEIQIWPKPDASTVSTKNLYIVVQDELQIFTNLTQTVDMPREWQMAVIYGLANVLAPEYSIPLPDRQVLQAQSDKFLQTAIDNSGENASFMLYPDMYMYGHGS